jgi:hypothetical protein
MLTYAAEEEARLVAALLMYQHAYILVFEMFFLKICSFSFIALLRCLDACIVVL